VCSSDLAAYSWLGCFVASWFVPFQHYDLVVSQTLLAAGMAYFMLVFFFCLERVIHFKVPLLSTLGKNGLLMYIASLVLFIVYVQTGIYGLITAETAWCGLVLVIASFSLLGGIAAALGKRKVVFRL
jgi:hypothetical protein